MRSAADYLRSRGANPVAAAELDLARVLPADADMSSVFGPLWTPAHCLIVPLFDARGVMRSLLARSIDPTANPKSLAPSGYQRGGLLMVDPLALHLLRTGARPEWWPDTEELRIVIAEGEIDWLICATQWSDGAACAPATFGIVSGSWTPEIAARIPDGSTVVIATDHDPAGEKYAAQIVATLAERNVSVERWQPTLEESA